MAFSVRHYLIALVRPFPTNRDAEIRSQTKIYLCDTGLMRRFSRVPDGALFDNATWLALRQRGQTGYFRKKSGVEIDFVVDGKIAFEIKQKADAKDVSRLKQLAAELGLPEYRVVSRKWCEVENVIYGYQL